MSHYFVQPKIKSIDVLLCINQCIVALTLYKPLIINDHGPGGRSTFVQARNEGAVSGIFDQRLKLNLHSWDDVYE